MCNEVTKVYGCVCESHLLDKDCMPHLCESCMIFVVETSKIVPVHVCAVCMKTKFGQCYKCSLFGSDICSPSVTFMVTTPKRLSTCQVCTLCIHINNLGTVSSTHYLGDMFVLFATFMSLSLEIICD